MKRYRIFGLIAVIALAFTSCETEVIDPAGARDEAIIPEITELRPAVFDSKDMENTFVQFTLNVDEPSVSEAIVIASYNNDMSRTEITRVSSFPATIQLKLADVVSELGMQLDEVSLGDAFTFEVLTIQNGKTYRSSASFVSSVVCAYDVEAVTGSYRAVSDAWAVDGTVTITADPADEYTLYVAGLAALDGLTEDKGPLKLVINPDNFDVTAVKTALASSAFGYTNLSYAGSGKLNTCDGSYQMLFNITVDQGSFGSFDFTFTKN